MPSGPDRSNSIRLPAVLAIGFTGHRSLKNEPRLRQQIRDFLRQQKAAFEGIVYGVSSAAAGGDQLFAESCLELDIPLRVLLPRPAEQFREDFDDASWQRTERIMKDAVWVEVTGGNQGRKEQFYDCGIQTVTESQLLVALWDGQPSRGAGGTQEIVYYAEKIGHPVAWIHSESGNLQLLNSSAVGQIESHSELDFLNGLPDEDVELPAGSPRDLANAWLRKVDENASRFAPQARRVASIPIVYTAAAAVLSGVAPEIPAAAPWLAVSAVLGIVAIALPAALRLHARQSLWARTRTAAEISRSVLAMWSTPALYEVIGAEVLAELSGVLRSLNYLKMEDGSQNDASPKEFKLDDFKQEYRRDRVAHQIDYFSRQAVRAKRQERQYEVAGWVFGALASLIALGYLVTQTRWIAIREIPHQWIALTMSALFEIATMAGAFAGMKDCARRRRRYSELSERLRHWDRQLDALHTWTSVLQVVERIERALLVELFEWRSLVLGTASHRK
jgi:hypothetical protein